MTSNTICAQDKRYEREVMELKFCEENSHGCDKNYDSIPPICQWWKNARGKTIVTYFMRTVQSYTVQLPTHPRTCRPWWYFLHWSYCQSSCSTRHVSYHCLPQDLHITSHSVWVDARSGLVRPLSRMPTLTFATFGYVRLATLPYVIDQIANLIMNLGRGACTGMRVTMSWDWQITGQVNLGSDPSRSASGILLIRIAHCRILTS